MRYLVTVCALALALGACGVRGPVALLPSRSPAQPGLVDTLPGGIQFSPAPSFWVTLPFENKVAIVDPATGELKNVLKFPEVFASMIVSPTQPLLFATEFISHQVDFVNTNAIRVVASVPMGEAVTGMATTPSGDKLYVVAGTQVVVISVRMRSIVGDVALPSTGSGVAIGGSQDHKLLVTLPGAHEIAIVNTTTNAVTKLVDAGRCIHEGKNDPCSPRDIAMSPAGRYAIAVSGRNALGFDTYTDKVLASTEVRGHIFRAIDLAIDPSTDSMWIKAGGFERSYLSQVSMAPPFNVVSSTITILLNGAAISPIGVGFASTGTRIVSFPLTSGGKVIRMNTSTASVAYVP